MARKLQQKPNEGSVGAGRTARVAYAVVPGFKTESPTIETVQENWDQVMDTEGLVIARSGAEDTNLFEVGFDAIGMDRMDPGQE